MDRTVPLKKKHLEFARHGKVKEQKRNARQT